MLEIAFKIRCFVNKELALLDWWKLPSPPGAFNGREQFLSLSGILVRSVVLFGCQGWDGEDMHAVEAESHSIGQIRGEEADNDWQRIAAYHQISGSYLTVELRFASRLSETLYDKKQITGL